jgi:hypothetical protein
MDPPAKRASGPQSLTSPNFQIVINDSGVCNVIGAKVGTRAIQARTQIMSTSASKTTASPGYFCRPVEPNYFSIITIGNTILSSVNWLAIMRYNRIDLQTVHVCHSQRSQHCSAHRLQCKTVFYIRHRCGLRLSCVRSLNAARHRRQSRDSAPLISIANTQKLADQ